jgi:hypothetical protein
MALTRHLAPQSITPVYNNVIAAVSSTEKNEEGFQYIFDLKDATTGLRISRVKLPANLDGYGVLDAQRTLESKVSCDVFPSMVGWSAATNSFFRYHLEYGHEFTYTFNFKDNFFNGGRVGFTGSTPHYFSSGDTVLITQNPTGATNTQYNGVHSVYQVIDNYGFVIDLTFGASTPPQAGTAVYSDFRKTLFTGLTNDRDKYIVNSAMNHQDFRTYNANDYILNTVAPAQLLTSVPNGWQFDLDSQAYLLAFQTGGTNAKFLKVTLDNGNTYFINNPAPTEKTLAVGVGTYNINQALGGVITSAVKSYTVQVTNASSAATSVAYTFEVYSHCSASPFNQFQIVGLDRMGSMVSFNFDLASKQIDSIKRDEFKKIVGSYSPTTNTWGYNSFDRGRTVNNIDVTSSFTVTSDWVTEEQVAYLAELYSSPEVYHIDSAGNWLAIIVTNDSFDHKYRNREKLFNYTLTFEYANRDQVQRG